MAGTNKLSDKKLKSLLGKEATAIKFYADGDGLNVKVTKAGSIAWYFNYRLGGREASPLKLKLGNYPSMSLKLAREKRDLCKMWLAEGKDPRNQLRLTIEETLKPVTVREALEYWIEEYARDHRANVEKHLSQLNCHIYPYIGEFPLVECETRYWVECFDRIKKTSPVAAGYIFQMCKQALKFCRVRRFATSNALDDLVINDVGRKQRKRDRIHTDDELSDVWISLKSNKFTPYYRNLLQILIVFGCRTKEVRLSTWSEWDLNKWIWTVPKEHSKTDTRILRPIPKQLRVFIKTLHEEYSSSGLLLGEMKESSCVSQWGRVVWKKMGHKESWVLHDFRRSMATKLNDLGIAPHVVEQLLGHSMPGVMAIYNHSQYLPEKLNALEVWFDRIEKLSGKLDS
ncbi:tyrosine-type recombinase/integrase [Serratia marcescens]|uniref:Site-specific integrase n=1 Tax=Serratia marcescens TaxID=615 RepID=A0A9X8YRU5_SERMA|nr:site-specific integrase [Serratia marcescens]MBS3894033.1 tyrosine-type recombinase/integrase [Serratia marcescens]